MPNADMSRARQIAEDASEAERSVAAADREVERAFRLLVRKLDRLTSDLEEMGENDMGLLRLPLASRFHTATAKLRSLTADLQQDVMWPREPGPARRGRHAFQAVQVEQGGGEAILDIFTVTRKRSADEAAQLAEALCEEARKLPHRPAAFVREINARE